MEKTLQAQYNLIKEGKGDKTYFLKSAYRLFPDMLSQINSFTDTVTILKNRGIISEGIGGLVTTGKKQDWHAIFNENMNKLKENAGDFTVEKHNGQILKYFPSHDKALAYIDQVDPNRMTDLNTRQIKNVEQNGDKSYTITYEDDTTKTIWVSNDAWDYLNDKYHNNLPESKEAKDKEKEEDEELARRGDEYTQGMEDIHALPNKGNLREAKEKKEEPSKEVLDTQKHNFDYKDTKNYDNVFGEEFLKGYYTEMKDPKNAGKDVEELRAIVAKNLAKDINHYVKDGQFGVKGLGYTTKAPGLGEPKEPKGKFKSSGYGDLKESVLRSQIYLLIKETLDELQKDPKAYADEEEFENKIIAKLKNDLRIKNKQHMTKTGEPDMDLVHQYNDAIKFANKNIQDITSKFFSHDKPEGGVDDAVGYVLSNAGSNPIHEAKKKPSAGLTKKEKSTISKKIHKGKDIGKKGKGFEKVAKAAEKQYGSEEAGKKVAAAAMWKNLAKGGK